MSGNGTLRSRLKHPQFNGSSTGYRNGREDFLKPDELPAGSQHIWSPANGLDLNRKGSPRVGVDSKICIAVISSVCLPQQTSQARCIYEPGLILSGTLKRAFRQGR